MGKWTLRKKGNNLPADISVYGIQALAGIHEGCEDPGVSAIDLVADAHTSLRRVGPLGEVAGLSVPWDE